MATYEILDGAGIVTNTIAAAEAFVAAQYPGRYRLVEEVAVSVPLAMRITRLAFRNRFTSDEKVALYNAAVSNVQIRIYLDDLNAATYIDLARADTQAGVQALEAAGIIGVGRAAQILTTPPGEDEIFRP